MKLTEKGKGKWEVTFYYDHPLLHERKRFRRYSPFPTKRKSETWAAGWQTKMENREYWLALAEREARERIPTLAEYLPRFIHESRRITKPGTRTAYESKIRNHVLPTLGGIRLDSITTTDMTAVLAKIANDNTARSVCVALGALFTWAEDHGVLPPDCRPKMNAPSIQSPADLTPVFLSDEQLARLLEVAHERIRTLIEVAVRTGLRIAELLGLIWDDVDAKRKKLRVARQYSLGASVVPSEMPAPKGDRTRWVPITDATLAILESHRKTVWAGETFVFSFAAWPEMCPSAPDAASGSSLEPIHPNRLRSVRETAFAAAGIPESHRGWHCLRHTYAARLATDGMSLRELQKLLGHSSVRTTEIYASLLPKAQDEARGRLEKLGM